MVIMMLYELGEVLKIDMEVARDGSLIRTMILAILTASPLQHSHPAVQRAAMETVGAPPTFEAPHSRRADSCSLRRFPPGKAEKHTSLSTLRGSVLTRPDRNSPPQINRFSSVLKTQQESIPGVCSAFLQLIVGGTDATVRTRACYLLLRVVKSLRGCCASHVPLLLSHLVPILLSDEVVLDQQERLQLFETGGQLLAAEGVRNDARMGHLVSILGPLLDGMEQAAGAYSEGGEDAGRNRMLSLIANRLECIGWLSKGLWKLNSDQETLFYRSVDFTLSSTASCRVPTPLPPHPLPATLKPGCRGLGVALSCP